MLDICHSASVIPPPSSSHISSKMAGSSIDVDLLMEECDDMPDLVDMLPDGGKLPSLIDQNTQELTSKDPEEFVSVSISFYYSTSEFMEKLLDNCVNSGMCS